VQQPDDGMKNYRGVLDAIRNRRTQGTRMGHVMRHLFLLSLFVYSALWAQEQAYTPKVGSPERKAILGALRSAVRSELKKPVVFRVDHLKVQGGWAFMRGMPRQPSGKPMNYQGTPYYEAITQGMFDDWICALLQKQGGEWRLVTYAIGATDVPYVGWAQQYHVPQAIFD
jgi:hypothetical protein